MARLLVTGDIAYGVLAAVRALRAAGHETWVTVSGSGSYVGRSRAVAGTVHTPDSEADPDGFAAAVAMAAERLAVAAVLPGEEAALTALAGRETTLPTGVALAVPAPDVVRRATDKWVLAGLTARAGLRSPSTTVVERAEIAARASDLPYPAVIKPLRSKVAVAGGGLRRVMVQRVESPAELRAAAASMPGERLLVQPHVAGPLLSVAGVAWQGELVCASHQVARRIYPPVCGVSAYAETIPRDPELEERIARLLRSIGWSGIFQAQFIRSGDTHYLIDLNPRIFGSLALPVAAGLNLPAIWVDLLLGGRPAVNSYRVGTRYRAEEKDAGALLGAFARGQFRVGFGGLIPRRRTVHAVYSLKDPRPTVTTLAKVGRLVGDRLRGGKGRS